MAIFYQIFNRFVKKIDNFVINNLTVERGKNKRKFIWKTKNFREITQLYIPKLIFIGFVVIMCWKINDKVVKLKNKEGNYKAKSRRQEKVEEEEKVKFIMI
jgi:hypothetical protein